MSGKFILISLVLIIGAWGAQAHADDARSPKRCTDASFTEAQRELLWRSAEDAAPEVLLGARPELYDTHYYISDEEHPEIVLPHIQALGGGYVGVGSDQAYLFIGWQQPQVAWVIDYDPHIVALHHIHQAFLSAAETPKAFIKLWSSKAAGLEILTEKLADFPDQKLLKKVWKKGRYRVPKRLKSLQKTFKTAKVDSYINHQPTYDRVRRMVTEGCVRPMLANLLDVDGLKGIGDTARELNIPIRVLYLSNAEEYWSYNDPFRSNVNGLFFDDRSKILRTIASSKNVDYRYHLQGSLEFLEWLRAPWLQNVYQMAGKLRVKDREHYPFSVIDYSPEEGHRRWKAKLARRRAQKAREKKAAQEQTPQRPE